MLQPYFCACVCAVILNVTLVTEGPCKRMGVRPFELIFPAVLVMALSAYEVKPFPELRFDPAVVLLPFCLMLMAQNQKDPDSYGKKLFWAMFCAALLPIAAVAGLALFDFIQEGYAFVNLTSSAVALWQIACCTLVFLLFSGLSIKKKAL